MKPLLCVLAATLPALVGCRSSEPEEAPPTILGDIVIEPLALRAELQAFADEATATIAGTASEIATRSDESTIRERTLTWRLRVVPLLRSTAAEEDTRWAFLRLWVLVTLAHESLASGPTSTDFGDQQELAVDALAELQRRIRATGVRHFGEEAIAASEGEVEEYVKSSVEGGEPVAANAVVQGFTTMGEGVRSILELPLKPFTGIDDTATAIQEVARVGAEFHRTLDILPDVLRWQTELLLIGLENVPAVRESLASAGTLATGVDRIASTAASLPADVRRELDAAQPELRATLAEVRATLDGVRETLGTADGTAAELTETANALRDAADALLPVAQAVRDIATPDPDAPPPDPDARPFDITDYTEAARAVEGAAERIDSIVARLESDAMRGTLSAAGGQAEAVVDRAVRGALIVLAAAVAGALVYRIAAARLARAASAP